MPKLSETNLTKSYTPCRKIACPLTAEGYVGRGSLAITASMEQVSKKPRLKAFLGKFVWCLLLMSRGVVFFAPKKMKGENSQPGYENFHDQ
jgi:hypothetical protein